MLCSIKSSYLELGIFDFQGQMDRISIEQNFWLFLF